MNGWKRYSALLLSLVLLLGLLPPGSLTAQSGAVEAAVHIESDPAGADVYLDGELYCPSVTPCDIPMESGTHSLSVRMAGYDSYETTVQAGQSVSAHLRAAIPDGPNVRTITVNRDEHGYADARLMKWEYYERFLLRGEPRPEVEWYDGQPESDYYPEWAYDALTDGISLREALCIIETDTGWYDEDNQIRWYYIIEFAAQKLNPYGESDLDNDTYYVSNNLTCYGRGAAAYLSGEPLFEKYSAEGTIEDTEAKALWRCDGCFTINGDRDRDGVPDVTLAGWEDWAWDGRWSLMLTCSDVHAVGLKFAPTMHVSTGTPFWQPLNYFDLREIYITGCTFDGIRNGVGRFFGVSLGAIYGHTASGYGEPGTYDLDGYYVTGCSFLGEQLGFIFAGGDQDYARAKNLVIQGNHLINGSIFVRNVDAHTWYMWPGNGEMSGTYYGENCIGYAEYNILEDVTISGNTSEFTAEVIGLNLYDGSYGSVVHLGNSNLGGSHNTMRNVTVRCNRSMLEQENIDAFEHWGNAGVSICNASVGDGLHEAYDGALASSLCQVSDNLFENLTVEYNDFALTCFTLENISLVGTAQVGTNNCFRSIRIQDNKISTVKGLHIFGMSGTSNPGCEAEGTLEALTISGNELRALHKTGWGPESNINSSSEQDDYGIQIIGAWVADYDGSNWDEPGEKAALDKLKSSVSGVQIEGNRITGFANGILIAAADSERTHYVTGITVDDVTIRDNEIVTDGVNQNCRNDGIVLAAAIDGGTNCVVHQVEVSGNQVSANNGLLATGFWYRGMTCRWGLRDNQVLHVSAKNNRFSYQAPNDNGGFPIVTADAVSGWGEIPYALGRSAVVLSAADNTAAGYRWDSMALSALSLQAPADEAAFPALAQQCSDDAVGSRYIDWSKDQSAEGCEVPLFVGVCDKPNYRPGNLHRYYLCPCESGARSARETLSAPACTEPGIEGLVTYCAFCDAELSCETEETPALGHDWDEGTITTEPSNTSSGVKTFVCRRCGTIRTEQIPPLDPVNPFTDVIKGKYYYTPVLWAYYHDPQITSGTGDTTFGPNDTCTRAQIVTFLWRAAGSPEPETTDNPFTDVKSGKYYCKPVLWAFENGITSGSSETTFGPNDGCTRGQVVTFLWRYAGSPGPETSDNPFTDVKLGKYYYKAVLWAFEKGITSGTSDTTFGPDDTCTRGQIVTFLYKYLIG